jgi:hypothetical protein
MPSFLQVAVQIAIFINGTYKTNALFINKIADRLFGISHHFYPP